MTRRKNDNNKWRDVFLKDLKGEFCSDSIITSYLATVGTNDPEMAAELETTMVRLFKTEDGLKVLKLFEKAVLYRSTPNGIDDRALREDNAVRNFNLEIRRIVSNGIGTNKTN